MRFDVAILLWYNIKKYDFSEMGNAVQIDDRGVKYVCK